MFDIHRQHKVMTDETAIVMRGDKSAKVINALSELSGIDLGKATDIFYRSETAVMIEEKIADLHCRSDKYLATMIMEEYNEKKAETVL